MTEEVSRLRYDMEEYRRKYENEIGQTGKVREDLKNAEKQVRDLQNEVRKKKQLYSSFIHTCFFIER